MSLNIFSRGEFQFDPYGHRGCHGNQALKCDICDLLTLKRVTIPKCECISLFSLAIRTFWAMDRLNRTTLTFDSFFFNRGDPFRFLRGVKLKVNMKVIRFYRPISQIEGFAKTNQSINFLGIILIFSRSNPRSKVNRDLQLDLCDLLTLEKVKIFWFDDISLFS